MVLPGDSKVSTIKELLKFAYETFTFAFSSIVDSKDLFLSTDDDFLLPPNAQVNLALDTNQVIKLSSIVHKLGKKTSGPEKEDSELLLSSKKSPPLFNPPVKNPEVIPKKRNRRKIQTKKTKVLGKRTILELDSSESSSSSSSESSSS